MPPRRAVQTNTHSAIPKRALALGVLVLLIAAVLHRAFNSAQSPVPSIKPKKPLDAASLKLLEMISNSITADDSYDPQYPGSDAAAICRQNVVDLAEGLLDFPTGRADLESALNVGLSIQCIPEEVLSETTIDAGFEYATKKIQFSDVKSTPVILVHETRHFLRTVRHQTPECMMNGPYAAFPIYLKLHKTARDEYYIDTLHLQRYNRVKEAINEGLSVVKEFQRMWIATEGGQKLEHLSKEERKIFKKYRNAAKNCLSSEMPQTREISSDFYKSIYAKGWRPDKTDVLISTRADAKTFTDLEITSVSSKGNKYYMVARVVSSENVVLNTLSKMDIMPETSYAKQPEIEQTMESVEIVLEALSREAMETFFPALRKMIDADEAMCPLPAPASRNTLAIN